MSDEGQPPKAELLEIVELPEGVVVLRRADSSGGSGEPLASIRFSAEARDLLGGNAGNLGKAMIAAGLQMVGQMFQEQQSGMAESDATESHERDASAPLGASRGRLH